MAREAPLTTRELYRLFDELGIEVRQTSGGCTAVVLDTEIRVPMPGKPKAVVSPDIVRRIARAAGSSSIKEFREVYLGRTTASAGSFSHGVVAPTPSGPSKAECRQLAAELHKRSRSIENWVSQGTHSAAVYGRVYSALRLAAQGLLHWPPTSGDEAASSPNDSGFKPSSPDSIKTGVGRATGVTAKAATRGRTFTKWEHSELEGTAQ